MDLIFRCSLHEQIQMHTKAIFVNSITDFFIDTLVLCIWYLKVGQYSSLIIR